jgi:hypothetical protein
LKEEYDHCQGRCIASSHDEVAFEFGQPFFLDISLWCGFGMDKNRIDQSAKSGRIGVAPPPIGILPMGGRDERNKNYRKLNDVVICVAI